MARDVKACRDHFQSLGVPLAGAEEFAVLTRTRAAQASAFSAIAAMGALEGLPAGT